MAKDKPKKKGDAEKAEAAAEFTGYEKGYKPRLQKHYERVVPELKKRCSYDNDMMVPRLSKIVVNMGLGQAVANPKIIDTAREDMRLITGQHPVVRRSRKSIAGFKLRAGLPIGL